MSRLPVIVGFGGVNPAGRSSFHLGYRRLVIDGLNEAEKDETLTSLATLTNHVHFREGQYSTSSGETIAAPDIPRIYGNELLDSTLVRKITSDLFDTEKLLFQKRASLDSGDQEMSFNLRKRDLPDNIPSNWEISTISDTQVRVKVNGSTEVLFPDLKHSKVRTAGQLPTGFNPGKLYQSRNHPRGLQMTVFGASDALSSMGISLEQIKKVIPPDQIAVYASSGMNQLDDNGYGGMLKAAALGKRTTSKQCPLGFGEMTADFINAYIIGSVGATGGLMGACASFLYNLEHGVRDIASGKRRMVLVGTSEAPVIPEIIEGYRSMGALGEDDDILALDPGRTEPDYRRACRPFGYNCGFTIAESAQFVVLMDDELALQLGAQIHAAVPEVYVHADGFKKSISAPGVGNYLTLAKAAALGRSLLGEEAVRRKSYVHAHGTGTPQNRVTESHVLNEVAKAFGIQDWPVAAIKCYLGHSIGSAGGDQVIAALGTWHDGLIPGIFTLDEVADDVHASNLQLSREHINTGQDGMDLAFLNSKGFGGNNATAVMLAPHIARDMVQKKHGDKAMSAYFEKLTGTMENACHYREAAINGSARPIYRFGEGVLDGDSLDISGSRLSVPGYELEVELDPENNFKEYF